MPNPNADHTYLIENPGNGDWAEADDLAGARTAYFQLHRDAATQGSKLRVVNQDTKMLVHDDEVHGRW